MYGGREQFVKVCLQEGLTHEEASGLLAFGVRHKISIDDPFMTLALVLGLINNATALNQKSSQALADDAAVRTGKALQAAIESVVGNGLRGVKIRWTKTAGILSIVCLAVTFALGASLSLHHQSPSSEFWRDIAGGPNAAEWQWLIETSPSFPIAMKACIPGSSNFSVQDGRPYCSFRISKAAPSSETDWFSAALLGPSQKLGRFTPFGLFALGLGLGLAAFLAHFAFRKLRTSR